MKDGFFLDAFTDTLRVQARSARRPGPASPPPSAATPPHPFAADAQPTFGQWLRPPPLPSQCLSYNSALKLFALVDLSLNFRPAGTTLAQIRIDVIDMELYDDATSKARMGLEVAFFLLVRGRGRRGRSDASWGSLRKHPALFLDALWCSAPLPHPPPVRADDRQRPARRPAPPPPHGALARPVVPALRRL